MVFLANEHDFKYTLIPIYLCLQIKSDKYKCKKFNKCIMDMDIFDKKREIHRNW